MIKISRIDKNNPDFIKLIKYLDDDIIERDGEDAKVFEQHNKIDNIKFVVIAYKNSQAIGCGALKEFGDNMEIKRMFVLPESRGIGVASKILNELENWAYELSFNTRRLQTGKEHFEAISLYNKKGYRQIPNFGQYSTMQNCVCMEIRLKF